MIYLDTSALIKRFVREKGPELIHSEIENPRESEPLVPREGWLRGRDLNPRPLGYEPNELPDCSTPRQEFGSKGFILGDFRKECNRPNRG
jgi:hypothetical protein